MRDGGVPSAVLLIGGLMGAVLVVGVIIGIVMLAKGKADDASEQMVKQANDAINSIYTDYDQEIVSGSEVLTAIGKFKSDRIYVCVDNGKSTTYYYKNADGSENTNTIAKAKGDDLNFRISTSADFLGECIYDTDIDDIIGIKFTKQ